MRQHLPGKRAVEFGRAISLLIMLQVQNCQLGLGFFGRQATLLLGGVVYPPQVFQMSPNVSKVLLIFLVLANGLNLLRAQSEATRYQDVVLMLDTSGSMTNKVTGGPNAGSTRIAVLRDALKAYILDIVSERAPVRLTLLNFDKGVEGSSALELPSRTFSLPEQSQKALDAVQKLTETNNLGSRTYLYDAMEEALRVAEDRASGDPESTVCVYICTDGAEDKDDEQAMRPSGTAVEKIIAGMKDPKALADGRIFASLALMGNDRIQKGPDKNRTVSELVNLLRQQAQDRMAIYNDADFAFLLPPILRSRDVDDGTISKKVTANGVRFHLTAVPRFGGKTGQVMWMLRRPGDKSFSAVGPLGAGYAVTIPAEKFTKLGLYKLQAVASWDGGRVRSHGSAVFKLVPDQLEIRLIAKPDRVIEGDEVSFSIQLLSGDARLKNIVWDFGDGTVDTNSAITPTKDIKHVYQEQGRKEAKVTVTAADDGATEASTEVFVDSKEIDAFISVFVNGKKSFDQASIPEKNSAFGRITAGQDVVLKPSRDRTADGVEYTWIGADGARQTGASFRFETATPGTTDVTLRARRHSSDDTASIKVTVRPRAPWWILAVTGGVGAMMLAYLTFLLTGNKMADWKLSVWSPSQKTIPAPKLLNDYWSRTGKVAVVPFSVFKRDPLLSTLKDSTHNLRCARVPAGRNRLPGNVSYDGKRRDDGWSVIDQECSAKRSEWELTLRRSAPHSDKEDGKRRIRLEFAEQSRFGEKALLALAWIGVIGANAAVFWWIAGH